MNQPELALWIVVLKQQKSTGDDESTLTLSHPKSETEGTNDPAKWTSVQQKKKFKIESKNR